MGHSCPLYVGHADPLAILLLDVYPGDGTALLQVELEPSLGARYAPDLAQGAVLGLELGGVETHLAPGLLLPALELGALGNAGTARAVSDDALGMDHNALSELIDADAVKRAHHAISERLFALALGHSLGLHIAGPP